MLLTFNLKHGRDFSDELTKAKKVAEFAIKTHSLTTKDVREIGLKSAIACQVLRKYSRNKVVKSINKVQLTVPGQAIRHDRENRELYIPCLKLHLDSRYLPSFEKVNQIELDHEYAHICVTINEAPLRQVEKWIGVDVNSTGHLAVIGNPSSGKVQKFGKEMSHLHIKYSKMRRHLYIHGHPKVAKHKLRDKESKKVKDINHKISRAIVDEAVQQCCGIKMEKLSGIRGIDHISKPSRKLLHSWSFYQLQTMIEYKAKLLGIPVSYVDPVYTSQQCSRCGRLGTRNGKDFSCPHCGHVDHADANASFNIALRPSFEESDGRLHADRDVCKGRIDTPQEAPS